MCDPSSCFVIVSNELCIFRTENFKFIFMYRCYGERLLFLPAPDHPISIHMLELIVIETDILYLFISSFTGDSILLLSIKLLLH
jgi:hypothetical protein